MRTHARFSLGRHGLRWFLWTSIASVECRKVKALCAALNLSFNCLPAAPFNCVLPRCRKVKYLYDGDCSMCLSLVSMLKRQDDGQVGAP